MSIDDNPINDLTKYNAAMTQSMIDKMFFMDKIDAEVIVDFGCADGTLIQFMHRLFPEKQYFGYDINFQMVTAATQKNIGTAKFYFNWEQILERIEDAHKDGHKVALILNSVIHEVYAYTNADGVEKFWKQVNEAKADYIVLRDMCVSRVASRPSDPIMVARIKQIFSKKHIEAFEQHWGSLEENWSVVHFLLKYHYVDNWDRELNENYLALPKEDLLQKFPASYYPDFIEHFTLPYLRNKIRKDFRIDLQERTHLKLIMRKMPNA